MTNVQRAIEPEAADGISRWIAYKGVSVDSITALQED